MSQSIHILHLEDDLADAELVRESLATAQFAIEITCVQTCTDFESSLQRLPYDLVLADYHLPGYSGLSALKQVREAHPQMPFIFVSGTLGEDAAIECLTQGATDYVLKQRLSRLVPAVSRAIRESTVRKEKQQAMQEVALLSFALDKVREAAYLIDEHGRFQFVNEESCRSLGRSRKELLTLRLSDIDPNFPQEKWPGNWEKLRQHGSLLLESEHQTKHGNRFPVEVSANYFEFAGKAYSLALVRDITERVKIEAELRKLWFVVDQSPASIVLTNPEGLIEYVNTKFTQVSGYTIEEVLGKNPRIMKSGETSRETYKEMWDTITAGHVWHGEFHNKRKNGELFWEAALVSPVRSDRAGEIKHYVAIKEDITQRKKADLALRASLQEKGTLLREIHHRVKNNLQIISSLLSLQAAESGNPDVTNALAESQTRVRSMALVHEQLYRSEKFSAINFRDYLTSMSGKMMEFQMAKRVETVVNVDEVWLDIVRAIPCGLIVSELLTNCLKHAFVGRDEGHIVVTMQRISDNRVRLEVQDDGRGIPVSVNLLEAKTMGLTIIRSLVEQLDGAFHVESENGTHFIIEFPAPVTASPS
jgi:PAS domain S-box-containing protein